ncbi:MAG TPA: hypothetical protein VG013_07990 [Gemmataceae bacterium]|jgi:hypothetical protein|nr:hypothetical protein [Gemmataceae bacterium]
MSKYQVKAACAMVAATLALGLWLALVEPEGQPTPEGEPAPGQPKPEMETRRLEGLEFQAAVERKWTIPVSWGTGREWKVGSGTGVDPTASKPSPVKLGLRITNRTGKDLLFSDSGISVSLRGADGRELRSLHIVYGTFPARPPVRVRAGRSATLSFEAKLQWLGLPHGPPTTLHLIGRQWSIKGLGPGKYQLRLGYNSHEKGPDGWSGTVLTDSVQVELVNP